MTAPALDSREATPSAGSELARRIATSVLISRIRWLAVPLAVVSALTNIPPPINRNVLLIAAGVLALYNVAATLVPRLPARMVGPVIGLAVAGDVAAVATFMFMFARDPTDIAWAMFLLVGAEAGVLYRWRGVAWFVPPMMLALVLSAALAPPGPNTLVNLSQKAIETIGVFVLVAGLASANEKQRAAAESARERAESAHGQTQAAREELREANSHLQRATELKSEFLANMSHELRTPLSAIIGFSDLLLEGADGELTAEMVEDVTQINYSGRTLLELINDILDLSKIEAGRMTLEIEDVSMARIVDEVMAAVRPLADSRSLSFEAQLDRADHVVRGDALRIRQVLMNLVSNALKFTQQGAVTIRCRESDGVAEVSVSDTGIGISTDSLASIFGEFNQAENGTTRKYGGTGLGLAICKKLVELQQGSIGVESKVGRGSRFWFTIPAVATDNPAQVSVRPAATAGSPPASRKI